MPTKTVELTLSARLLHWSVAISILILLPMGFYMSTFMAYGWYDWHKSIGAFLLVILVFRVVYRVLQGWPDEAKNYTKIEQVLSRIVHWLLLVGVLVLPTSGFMYSGLGGYGVPFFGFELVPSNYIDGEAAAYSAYWSDVGKLLHTVSGWALSGIIILHIAGALKHHFYDNDNTLTRMVKGS
jgi:cytochrome b561